MNKFRRLWRWDFSRFAFNLRGGCGMKWGWSGRKGGDKRLNFDGLISNSNTELEAKANVYIDKMVLVFANWENNLSLWWNAFRFAHFRSAVIKENLSFPEARFGQQFPGRRFSEKWEQMFVYKYFPCAFSMALTFEFKWRFLRVFSTNLIWFLTRFDAAFSCFLWAPKHGG